VQSINYRAFGIPVGSPFLFPGDWNVTPPAADPTVIVARDRPPWPGSAEGGWRGLSDGKKFVVERSRSGEHRFSHDQRLLFHLSADHRELVVDPASARDVSWWRTLLDPVLFTVGLLRGKDALHAGAVATQNGAVAIAAPSGGGKSTLLAQLLSEGHRLLTDDVLFLDKVDGEVVAYPGPPLITLPSKAAGIGKTLERLEDEIWATVPVITDPVPLRRLVFLDRRDGVETTVRRVGSPLAPLLAGMLTFPQARDRKLSRFDMAAELATQTEICRLQADLSVAPSELAALVLEQLS
jgi:hypothetical protein